MLEIKEIPGFDDHNLLAFVNDNGTSLNGFIAIHRTSNEHPSFGATRLWQYDSEHEAISDALRLSKTMSYKMAMAGIPGGGAKAVLINNGNNINRKELFKEYAKRVNNFGGNFITGTDVGLYREDVIQMRRYSDYFVGVYAQPERFTAEGVLHSIRVVLNHLYGSTSVNNREFAIQGVGKVGSQLLELLYNGSNKIYVADIDKNKVKMLKKEFPNITVVDPDSIHKLEVDIFSPCALGSILNESTVDELNCKAIVGAANNQLEDPMIAHQLYDNGIIYAPDYVVNAGGLISVYDEFLNEKSKVKRVSKKVKKIGDTLEKILESSENSDEDPLEVANKMAESVFNGNS